MTDIPPRPDYPPYYASPTEPEIHIHLITETAEASRWNFAWLQIGKNAKAVIVSVVTGPWWAAALRDVQESQRPAGTWFLAWAAIGGALLFDRARQRFLTRVLVWTAVVGGTLALPLFAALVDIMTGGGQ